jgi:hypothetical protein
LCSEEIKAFLTNRDLKILNFNSTNFTNVYTEVEVEERDGWRGGGVFFGLSVFW